MSAREERFCFALVVSGPRRDFDSRFVEWYCFLFFFFDVDVALSLESLFFHEVIEESATLEELFFIVLFDDLCKSVVGNSA